MWQTEMVLLVRAMLDDMDEPYTYTDERLQTLIALAAKVAKVEIQFRQDYTIASNPPTISPDPTDANTLDEDFQVLVSLKAVCLLGGSKLNTAGIGDSITTVDGPTKIIIDGKSNGYKEAAAAACSSYAAAKKQYVNGTFTGGKVILSPFRVGDHGNGGYYLGRRDNMFSY